YPYDLDFIEDGLLLTSLRLANNQPVFIPPNADFVPHVYMPLYIWLGGLLFKVTGPSFIPLRLLSLAAIVSICGLIYWIARRESGQPWLGLVCAGLFLGGYRIDGFWYELARVDSLFVALALAGLTLGVYAADSNWGMIGAALGLVLAFLTKQTGLLLGVGLTLYLLLMRGRRAWWFGLSFGLLTLIPVIALNTLTQGWFLYYTFHIAGINPIEARRIFDFFTGELFGLMGGLSVMAASAALLGLRRVGWRIFREQPWLVWIGAAVFISGMSRASVGGNLNDRLPAYTFLCLAPAILTHELQMASKPPSRWQISIIPLLILIQFALGGYNPLHHIPTPAMRQGGDHLIEKIATYQGEVLVLMHPYYTLLAGKAPSAQLAAMWHARERANLPLPPDFVARLKQHYYSAIISDDSFFEMEPAFQQLLQAYYQPAETLETSEAPPTTSGMVVRPMIVYLPK
ncbi:MAG: glycosyltransferase family 39 protein, partial [Chloroflexi bacterium]|nr:glycosyltransferase family 39 protein [Chloroflexota bacterium]